MLECQNWNRRCTYTYIHYRPIHHSAPDSYSEFVGLLGTEHRVKVIASPKSQKLTVNFLADALPILAAVVLAAVRASGVAARVFTRYFDICSCLSLVLLMTETLPSREEGGGRGRGGVGGALF